MEVCNGCLTMKALFPRLASPLTVGGCLAVHMPDTLQEPIRALMQMAFILNRLRCLLHISAH
jgi:trans-aconitate methyltransferase